jgi:hypothetical protein
VDCHATSTIVQTLWHQTSVYWAQRKMTFTGNTSTIMLLSLWPSRSSSVRLTATLQQGDKGSGSAGGMHKKWWLCGKIMLSTLRFQIWTQFSCAYPQC